MIEKCELSSFLYIVGGENEKNLRSVFSQERKGKRSKVKSFSYLGGMKEGSSQRAE